MPIVELLAHDAKIEAAFFVNDTMAAGALMDARGAAGRRPGQVAIAGFGDFEVAEGRSRRPHSPPCVSPATRSAGVPASC